MSTTLRSATSSRSLLRGQPVLLPDSTVHALIRDRALLNSDRAAVVDGGRSRTFEELIADADAISVALADAGVAPGDFVVLDLPRSIELVSIELVSSVLGVLGVGAAFVPINPADPSARRRRVAAGIGASVAIAPTEADDTYVDLTTIHAGDVRPPAPPGFVPHDLRSTDLAYVMHTSGSTGAPKGVAIEHGPLLNYVMHCVRSYMTAG